MTVDQILLFIILGSVLGLLLWGRWRYDLVAFSALIIAVIVGVVPAENAFSGLGHPATVIVAIVLIISRGLYNSGAVSLLAQVLIHPERGLKRHIGMISSVGAGLSALMNNVAALAILMPVELENARKSKHSASTTLMPLSFATILGGMITLIGTPPNIIISQFRETSLGAPFQMFDFAPVGLACAVVGVAYVALIGWRLLPQRAAEADTGALFKLEGYIAELVANEESKAIGKLVKELDPIAEENDATVLGLIRNGRRLPGRAASTQVRDGDILVIEAAPDAIDAFKSTLNLAFSKNETEITDAGDMDLVEAVVPADSPVVGRTSKDIRLRARTGALLLGVARQGQQFRTRLARLPLMAGDVLLIYGPEERLDDIVARMGCLPLAKRGLKVTQTGKAWLAIGLFAAAIALATAGVLYLPIALSACAAIMVLTKIMPLREVYESVEWPVIVLLGSLIPIGAAFETAGGTALIAGSVVMLGDGLPAWMLVAALLAITMTLSDVLNNTATTIIAAPIGVDIAQRLGVNPDPFLMAVAVGASCAFLTPIGHKNNTLVMGPGGYAFGDYWRMGLPLEVLIMLVGVPMILITWPL